VTWAYRAGTDFDIAVSEWRGSAWSEPQFLTHETTNELDPEVFIDDDGTAHVVWWVQETDQVFVSTRQINSNIWGTPVQVTPEGTSGQYPSVVVWKGFLHVSYERATGLLDLGPKELVVMRRQGPNGAFRQRIIANISRQRPLEAQLHSHSGVLWADWLHSNSELGYSTGWVANWDRVRTTEWLDSSWVGIEDGRARIRSLVLNLNGEGPPGQVIETVDGVRDRDGTKSEITGGSHIAR